MNPYIQKLQEYLRSCEERGGFSGIRSLLDLLWECYSEGKPVDDGLIQSQEARLAPVMEALSPAHSDTLFCLISDLRIAYQRSAFLEGVTVGARLQTELSALP